MIEWIWLWAFGLLPVPFLVRWFFAPRQREQAALTVPSIESFSTAQSGPAQEEAGVGEKNDHCLKLVQDP